VITPEVPAGSSQACFQPSSRTGRSGWLLAVTACQPALKFSFTTR